MSGYSRKRRIIRSSALRTAAMKTHLVAITLFAVSSVACATAPKPGESFAGVNTGAFVGVADQVAFDHGCASDRIRVIRREEKYVNAIDLDVCGAVRRYKNVAGAWLNVTRA